MHPILPHLHIVYHEAIAGLPVQHIEPQVGDIAIQPVMMVLAAPAGHQTAGSVIQLVDVFLKDRRQVEIADNRQGNFRRLQWYAVKNGMS